MNRIRALAPLALAFLLSGAAPRPVSDTVVLLVRHAEKAGASGDVALSPDGEARARALVDVARQAGVSAVITTQFQRTKQTAAPLAKSLGITPDVIEAKGATDAHASAIADAIRQRFAGRVVLVVGHSNTVPAIIAALGAPKFPDLCDEQYDALFVVVLPSDASPRLIRSRYGATSQLTAQCGAMTK
jgi:broad specificity phosphatase PhoE